MLSKNQFDVLDCIINSEEKLSQRTIAKETGLSVGTINKLILSLCDKGFLNKTERDDWFGKKSSHY